MIDDRVLAWGCGLVLLAAAALVTLGLFSGCSLDADNISVKVTPPSEWVAPDYDGGLEDDAGQDGG